MLSSLVAVAAVVAIVAGLLVLFGTRGNDSKAGEKPVAASTTSKKPSAGPSTVGASVPRPSEKPTQPPAATEPTSAPTTPPTVQQTQPSSTEPPTTTQPTQPVTIPAEERPAIEVYNNTPRKGLADSVASRARQAGWTVSGSPDNWHGKVVESTVYYPPGMLAAANQLAHDLGVGRSKGALDNMKKDRLTVILTSDYAG
ncbi:pyruvate/2-oxoglutarate dehydrogenase complex dihydrolipoamide acyltransferase (E2) component [Kribbella aluminosa]|uniref:Pyruvate/2-oxoglutarate dehydrogenase complex dihydrolipoamide acyltransferase (E2) component n=1 Tax=Kribbella aluminosa TaxID=416017 RepID=A0ABS4UTY6_9ACTN|nr:LytR C-terminal domain-containing protein [Kribbella aluminosa]MBP2355098.1 pyruvate/2-oxoglutarate dehydrogenase complex dihydrolipoamide acyltransferase (E2) component [Kribbella aluminosa]